MIAQQIFTSQSTTVQLIKVGTLYLTTLVSRAKLMKKRRVQWIYGPFEYSVCRIREAYALFFFFFVFCFFSNELVILILK